MAYFKQVQCVKEISGCMCKLYTGNKQITLSWTAKRLLTFATDSDHYYYLITWISVWDQWHWNLKSPSYLLLPRKAAINPSLAQTNAQVFFEQCACTRFESQSVVCPQCLKKQHHFLLNSKCYMRLIPKPFLINWLKIRKHKEISYRAMLQPTQLIILQIY
jgi:hypothetical protein